MARVDGVHDLGGVDGYGPVAAPPDEPVFAEPWEARAFGVTMAALLTGRFNTPMFRHAIERMDPLHYLSSPYYEHWLTGVTTLLVEGGSIDVDALEERAGGAVPLARPVSARADAMGLEPTADDPQFRSGDRVRVRDRRPFGHTRCPRYVRGRSGRVERALPPAPVPEIEAHRREVVEEPVYTVRFEGADLWGEAAEAGTAVHVDLYERYLEAAGG
jgi:nitrile hydratase subunit beta